MRDDGACERHVELLLFVVFSEGLIDRTWSEYFMNLFGLDQVVSKNKSYEHSFQAILARFSSVA